MATMYSVQLDGLDEVRQAFTQAPEMVRAEIRRFMRAAVAHLQAEVVDRTPTAHGDLRRSIIGRVEATADGALGVVGSPLAYAAPVELGTKPHWVGRQGMDSLTTWVKQKIPLGQAVSVKTGRPLKSASVDDQARRIAFLIARKIARKGTKGAFMFRDALAANRGEINALWASTVARIVQRLGGTA